MPSQKTREILKEVLKEIKPSLEQRKKRNQTIIRAEKKI